MRDYTTESQDLPSKKYSYDFDEYIRKYLVTTYSPHLHGGWCLEVGCGKGELTKFIDPYFDVVTGVDPIVNTTLESYETSSRYDAIIMHNVLEHVEDTDITLGCIKALLKKNGKFFVSVPNAHAASRQLAVRMGILESTTCVTPDEHTHGHRRTYTMEMLEAHLKKNDFKIVQAGGVLFKGLSNWQMDYALERGVITDKYIEACYDLGRTYPELCSTLYAVCEL